MSERAETNIGARGAARRRKGGIFWLVVALAASAWLVARGGPLAAYAGLAVAYAMAALGFLQARERT